MESNNFEKVVLLGQIYPIQTFKHYLCQGNNLETELRTKTQYRNKNVQGTIPIQSEVTILTGSD